MSFQPAKSRPANWHNCNHYLPKKVAEEGQEMSQLYGNASFDWRAEGWKESTVNQLLEQDFLRHASDQKVFRSIEIMGKGR